MPWNFSILSTVIMCRSIRYFQFFFCTEWFSIFSFALSRKHAVHHHAGTNALARNEIVNISSESMRNSGLKKEDWKMGRKRIKYKVRWSVCVVCNLKFIKHSNLLRSFFDPNATAMECDSKWNERGKKCMKKVSKQSTLPYPWSLFFRHFVTNSRCDCFRRPSGFINPGCTLRKWKFLATFQNFRWFHFHWD